MEETEAELKLASIFVPNFFEKRLEYLREEKSFVHYTSASNAISIIRGRKIWMRNVKCMNDFMEIEHGFEILRKFLGSDGKYKDKYFSIMDGIWPDQAKTAIDLFDNWLHHIRNNCYVTCISEHDRSEDRLGRLSMWRAYGQNNIGAAIVINNRPFNIMDDIGIVSSPVLYTDENNFENEFTRCLEKIESEAPYIKQFGPKKLHGMIFLQLLLISLCTKHPGFHEEKEWRIMFIPKMWDAGNLVEESVEVIGGIPQIIYKINLDNNLEKRFIGVSPNELIERIIIGPCLYPTTVKNAFVSELRALGVDEPEKRVFMSEIPLRT